MNHCFMRQKNDKTKKPSRLGRFYLLYCGEEPMFRKNKILRSIENFAGRLFLVGFEIVHKPFHDIGQQIIINLVSGFSSLFSQ